MHIWGKEDEYETVASERRLNWWGVGKRVRQRGEALY
jgi:hypothetical protein